MRAVLASATALLLASAGCLGFFQGDGAAGGAESVSSQAKKPATGTGIDVPRPARDPNLRWHYHNYWGATGALKLLETNLTLPLLRPDTLSVAARSATIDFTLPQGQIVPPETGEITVVVHFTPDGAVPFTGLNFSYRPGGAVNYTGYPVESGKPLTLAVSYDQTDVPHRGSSAWRFRLGPDAPSGPAIANGTAHVVIEAKIGRPLLIDPPHFDQWRGRTAIPLASISGNLTVVKIADGRYANADPGPVPPTLPLTIPPSKGASVQFRPEVLVVPLPNGSLVPERTKEVVVHLVWNATPGSPWKLGLAYAEDNRPSNGTLVPATDEVGKREYRIPVEVGMSDSPYANQSTWRFYVLVEGTPTGAMATPFTLHATAERVRT